jgi:alanine racemase
MSDLTRLTLKAALDGLEAKTFSSVELTQAHIDAVAQAGGTIGYELMCALAARVPVVADAPLPEGC